MSGRAIIAVTFYSPAMCRVQPERFVAGGEALARDADGRVVFVRGGVPGDDVSLSIIEDKGDWARGTVTEVHVPSADRVEPPCPRRREGCGGCDWQHLDVARQLPAKVEILRDAMRRTGKLPDAVLTVGGSVPAAGYRTTVRVVGDHAGRPSFRRDHSHETVPAAGCLVADAGLQSVLDATRLTPELEATFRVSVATGEMTARWDPRQGDVTGLPPAVAVGPSAILHEDVAGWRFQVAAASFFQSGPAAAELLVAAVRRAAPELAGARTVLDAYAGVGLFALAATAAGASVITVETSRSAVADSRVNLAGRSARVERMEFGTWRAERDARIDVAIADPSRSGLGRPGVAALTSTEAPVLVLVSCDPVALARDAGLLARHGYRHDGSEVLDLFPHTHHVEAVTRFVRD
jgi:23S rRNA (uracil1939-C5)-methyltransferase